MEYGVVNRNKTGRSVSGDAYLFIQDENQTLVALIDGLGSGEAAHQAAVIAQASIAAHPHAALTDILNMSHQALHSTRGVVMMLMRVEPAKKQVSFAGVGNIGVRVFSQTPIKPISRNGIVGYRMNNVREFVYPYTPGDVFVLHSDGISTRFMLDENWARNIQTDVQQIAEEIAEAYAKDNDDVTVMVIR